MRSSCLVLLLIAGKLPLTFLRPRPFSSIIIIFHLITFRPHLFLFVAAFRIEFQRTLSPPILQTGFSFVVLIASSASRISNMLSQKTNCTIDVWQQKNKNKLTRARGRIKVIPNFESAALKSGRIKKKKKRNKR